MTVAEMRDKVGLKVLGKIHDREIEGVFISDMVSDAMAWASAASIWITTQTHKNVIAAANLVDIAAIIFPRGKSVTQDVLDLAEKVEMTLFTTEDDTYALAKKLNEAGL